jgi:hypothetical protein
MTTTRPHPFHLFFITALIALIPAQNAGAQDGGGDDLPEGIRIDADGVPRFDSVFEERIRPEGAPDQDLSERPAAILEGASLPEPPTEQALAALASAVRPATVEIIALVMPPQPYRQVPMLYRGHAVWLSAHPDASHPVLISPVEWLKDAEQLYLVPDSPNLKNALPATREVSLASLTVGGEDMEEFERIKPRLTRLKLASPDSWRGITQLDYDAGPRLPPPTAGLPIADLQREQIGLVYGYSPSTGAAPAATSFAPPPADDDPALSFFFRSPFPAILGAPLVDLRGRLVGLTSLRHPKRPTTTLVIPPAAIASYVRARQGIAAPSPHKKEAAETPATP